MPVLDIVTPVPGPVGATVISAPSISTGVTMPNHLWWLIDPDNFLNNITMNVKNDTLPIVNSEVQAQHLVLGAKYVNVIADVIKGAVFQLEVDFLDDPSWNAFVNLRSMQKTLLLQAPYSAQWWVRIGSDVIPALVNVASLYRDVTFQVTEQARP